MYTSRWPAVIAPPLSWQIRSPSPSMLTRVPNGSDDGHAAVTPWRTCAPLAVTPNPGSPRCFCVDSYPAVYAVIVYVCAGFGRARRLRGGGCASFFGFCASGSTMRIFGGSIFSICRMMAAGCSGGVTFSCSPCAANNCHSMPINVIRSPPIVLLYKQKKRRN